MLVPLSWLKEYIEIDLDNKTLGDKLTEVGLGVEKIVKEKDDTIFELEITPNRPDCLSIVGIAREIAAIEGKTIKYPKLKKNLGLAAGILPLDITTDPEINPRFTGIVIKNIKVTESPEWLKKRLEQIGQRPINNIVDITNYVMFELGNPIHAFDYDKIKDNVMKVHQTKGGETFKSVDGISYNLPKGAVVISDSEKIIDLCGIKGGYNTGTFEGTKNIFIRVPVEIPTLIRRTSQTLGLRSEASSIFERGVNKGGTVDALKRCVDLIVEIAGGNIASKIYDIKTEKFEPWKLKLRIDRLNKILGYEIPQKQISTILENLNLSPKIIKDVIECTIPTYRNDLKIEEDLIEEVARLYGYNKFPKTLPTGEIPSKTIPYFKNYELDRIAKHILTGGGFSEVYTYSLIGEDDLIASRINPEKVLRIDNPVSLDFEYLRPSLGPNLIKAVKQNKSYFKNINLFELGKIYIGSSLDNVEEKYYLSAISTNKSFAQVKGLLERLFKEFGLNEDSGELIEIIDEGIFFEIDFSKLLEKANLNKKFRQLPKFPPIIEDLTFTAGDAKVGVIIDAIKKQSRLINSVSLLDEFENSKTLHIIYQDPTKNLTTKEVAEIRKKITTFLEKRFKAEFKE